MSDYNDIKRRLRELDTCDERGSFTPCPVGQAGADAIEALEKERDEARAERDRAEAACERATKGEAFERGIVAMRRAESDELRARVAELERIERLIRLRCEGWLCVKHQKYPNKRHAPECLVEEAGLT